MELQITTSGRPIKGALAEGDYTKTRALPSIFFTFFYLNATY